MPDWSYQTVFRPLLFRLEARRARDVTLGAMGRLSRLPGGPQLIEFMGHMRPPAAIARRVGAIAFPTPVGLDAGLDPEGLGIQPLSQFGFGYVEAGPVTLEPLAGAPVRRLEEGEAIWHPDLPVNPGVASLLERLRRTACMVPLGIRLAHAPGASPEEAAAERCRLMAALAEHAAFFTLETRGGADLRWAPAQWAGHLRAVASAAGRPVWICLAPDLAPERAAALVEIGVAHGVAGVIITGGVAGAGGRLEGLLAREPALALLRSLRDRFGPDLPVVAGGGIHEPADALTFLDAGATMVQIHAGLVYSGPGLSKRINEAVCWAEQPSRAAEAAGRGRGWLAAALMAAGIFSGGALASWIALTRVVLPYDERFVGLTRAQLATINPRLLSFMTHDRISLSGTMIASALLYFYIAVAPWREGEHWARPAYLIPAALGFVSFFLFPGYGYFEPLHALFYLALLPFFAAAWLRRPRGEPAPVQPSLRNDRTWLLGQWGQFLWIILAAGGTVAGLTIMSIGVTRVFVPEDLAFMGTTAEALRAVPRLVPLIAHDRVGFGTALTCNGLTVLLIALWGYRRGARSLWLTLFAAGIPSYVAAFGIHIFVGYTDLWHLAPPLAGLVVLVAALALSCGFLCAEPAVQSPGAPPPHH